MTASLKFKNRHSLAHMTHCRLNARRSVSAFLSFCGKKQFCAQIFLFFNVLFLFCFLTSCFVHKNVNTLS